MKVESQTIYRAANRRAILTGAYDAMEHEGTHANETQ